MIRSDAFKVFAVWIAGLLFIGALFGALVVWLFMR